MNDTEELELFQQAWREESRVVPDDLYRIVIRQTRLIRLNAALSTLLSLAFLGASLWKAVAEPSAEFIVLAVGVWIVTIFAATHSIRNWTGTWQPKAQNTSEFLCLSIRRSRAGVRSATFGLWLLLIQVLFIGSWHAWYWSRRTSVPSVGTWLLASALPLAFLIALLIIRSRRQRELRRLECLHRELMG